MVSPCPCCLEGCQEMTEEIWDSLPDTVMVGCETYDPGSSNPDATLEILKRDFSLTDYRGDHPNQANYLLNEFLENDYSFIDLDDCHWHLTGRSSGTPTGRSWRKEGSISPFGVYPWFSGTGGTPDYLDCISSDGINPERLVVQ